MRKRRNKLVMLLCDYPTGSCDFETGLCGWSQEIQDDDWDWLRTSGSTPSGGTGPSQDHTTGSAAGILYQQLV